MPSAQIQSQFSVVPYYKERDSFPPNVLALLYRKMVAQGIDKELLHNGSMLEEDFVRFADEQLTSIFLDLTGKYVGLAWLTNVEETDTLLKGLGAFVFFREYWKPEITEHVGNICLSHWFNALGFSLIYGITPTKNRAAQRYCKRIGFEYSAKIPGFVTYDGETCDAIIATMTNRQFNQKDL